MFASENDEKTLQEIRDSMVNQRGRELPGFARYDGCETYIKKLVDSCRPYARELLHQANGMVDETMYMVANEHFKGYPDIWRILYVSA